MVDLLRGAPCRSAVRNSRSRRTGWHELENQSANCLRLVFSGSTSQNIRLFKSVGSLNSHLPIFARARSGDRHAPLSWFVTQCVLKTSNNFPTQLSITEILQLNRQSHRTAILLKCLLPLCWCKPVKAAPDRAVKLAVEPLIHNTCLKIWERDKCDVRAGHTHGVPDES